VGEVEVVVAHDERATQLEADAFTVGNGTTGPQGVITGVAAAPGSVVTSALQPERAPAALAA
jgi:hypothetical protein